MAICPTTPRPLETTVFFAVTPPSSLHHPQLIVFLPILSLKPMCDQLLRQEAIEFFFAFNLDPSPLLCDNSATSHETKTRAHPRHDS
jgi:hypothetical protein